MSTNAQVPIVTDTGITITPRKSIFDNAVCLSVGREWPSLTKSLPKERIQTTGDKSKFHGSKDLYNSPHLKKLQNLEIALDNTLKRYASAPFPLKTGVYILSLDLYNEVEAILAKHVDQREELITAFSTQYDKEVAKAKDFQGDAFDPSDYSTGESVKSKFKFRWDYLTMDVAENLAKVGKDALARQQQKMDEVWQDAREATRQIMRGQMASMVNHLVDRLTPGEEGKKKIFRNTVFDPLNEFIRTFNPRDLTDDAQLRDLVKKAEQLVNGVSPEDLRNNEALKITVQAGFANIKSTLSTMVVEAADRDIEFGADEAVAEVVVQ